MISVRHWSKGSARNNGPQRPSGTVHKRASSGIDWTQKRLCGCGQTMRRCDACGEWVCNAPGHLKHVCGGAR